MEPMKDDWKALASCLEHPPKWWADDDVRAKMICLNCPVIDDCLRYCVEVVGTKTPGTWGGRTHAERNPNSNPGPRGPGGRFLKSS